MEEQPRRPPQYGLKWLFLLPLAIGLLTLLLTSGAAAELLFVLLGVPVIMGLWLALCRVASHFLTDLFD